MHVYRTLRSITLALRRAQTALLAATFIVSDYAERLGERAKKAAHAKLDAIERASHKGTERAWAAVGEAEARAEQIQMDHHDLIDDTSERRTMIDVEVL